MKPFELRVEDHGGGLYWIWIREDQDPWVVLSINCTLEVIGEVITDEINRRSGR